jgi:Na+/H+ antiporter NhaD/arsenite permease-like protein
MNVSETKELTVSDINWVGVSIFVVNWILLLARRYDWFPIGRAGGTMMCAVFMILFGAISVKDAEDSIGQEVDTLIVLFGTMLMVVYLAREHVFKHFELVLVGDALEKASMESARSFMIKICLTSGLVSAFLTNDTCCVFFTPVVVKICLAKNYPLLPFLVALATSSNIGSAGTPIGNPQNMVVANAGNVDFGDFVLYVGPVAMICLVLNGLMCWFYFRSSIQAKLNSSGQLLLRSDTLHEAGAPVMQEVPASGREKNKQGGFRSWLRGVSPFDSPISYFNNVTKVPVSRFVAAQDADVHRKSSMIHSTSDISANFLGLSKSGQVVTPVGVASTVCGCLELPFLFRRQARRISTVLICFGMLLLLLLNVNEAAVCLGTAAAFVVLDAIFTQRDPHYLFHRIDWVLLLFFAVLFISVEALNMTGLPEFLMDPLVKHMRLYSSTSETPDTTGLSPAHAFSHSFFDSSVMTQFVAHGSARAQMRMNELSSELFDANAPSLVPNWSGVSVYTFVVTILSNVVSNVPAVLVFVRQIPEVTLEALGGDPRVGWYSLAFISTVAGNLTLIGSMASLIVAETAAVTLKAEQGNQEKTTVLHADREHDLEAAGKQAEQNDENGSGHVDSIAAASIELEEFLKPIDFSGASGKGATAENELTFLGFTKFGFPSTILLLCVGTPLLILLLQL